MGIASGALHHSSVSPTRLLRSLVGMPLGSHRAAGAPLGAHVRTVTLTEKFLWEEVVVYCHPEAYIRLGYVASLIGVRLFK